MVLDEVTRCADDDIGQALADLDDVIGDQAVTAQHQIQGGFTLTDARLAQQQHAHTQHIDEDAVDRGGGGQPQLQQLLHSVNKHRRHQRR